MKKKAKLIALAIVLIGVVLLCSCVVPVPLMLPIVETPTIIPIEPVLV